MQNFLPVAGGVETLFSASNLRIVLESFEDCRSQSWPSRLQHEVLIPKVR